jgi:hypothetical protein
MPQRPLAAVQGVPSPSTAQLDCEPPVLEPPVELPLEVEPVVAPELVAPVVVVEKTVLRPQPPATARPARQNARR